MAFLSLRASMFIGTAPHARNTLPGAASPQLNLTSGRGDKSHQGGLGSQRNGEIEAEFVQHHSDLIGPRMLRPESQERATRRGG